MKLSFSAIKAKLRAILNSNSGETLMEGLVSILIFTILIISVTMMILVSLKITQTATDYAGEMQKAANAVLEENAPSSDAVVTFMVYDIVGDQAAGVETININVSAFEHAQHGFAAFGPSAPDGPEGGG